MKAYILIFTVIILNGCQTKDYTQAYVDFIDTYNAESRYYCDEATGFFMYDTISNDDEFVTTTYVKNNQGDPIECNYDIIEQLQSGAYNG